MNRKKTDVLSKIIKSPMYKQYSIEADTKIKFSVEVYNARKKLGWTQTTLARKAKTTQRIISNIEWADTDIGMGMCARVCRALEIEFTVK